MPAVPGRGGGRARPAPRRRGAGTDRVRRLPDGARGSRTASRRPKPAFAHGAVRSLGPEAAGADRVLPSEPPEHEHRPAHLGDVRRRLRRGPAPPCAVIRMRCPRESRQWTSSTSTTPASPPRGRRSVSRLAEGDARGVNVDWSLDARRFHRVPVRLPRLREHEDDRRTARVRDFARLDAGRHVYLDYTGSGPLRRVAGAPARGTADRPKSSATPTRPTRRRRSRPRLVERARDRVLSFFNASPDDYDVIFTANASQALKLVAESYPFEHGGRFLLTFDNHNSVNGIREFARARGATVTYVPVLPPDMRLDEAALAESGARRRTATRISSPTRRSRTSRASSTRSSGSSGRRRPAGTCCSTPRPSSRPTGSISRRWHPDFVVLSFYKIFGYPTGVGALLATPAGARQTAAAVVRGRHDHGRVGRRRSLLPGERLAGVRGRHGQLPEPAGAGTGIRPDRDASGIDTIHQRVRALCGWLIDSPRRDAALDRAADGPHLRADHAGRARRNGHAQLPRRRGATSSITS